MKPSVSENHSLEAMESPSFLQDGDEGETVRKFNPQVYWYLSFRCNLSCTHCWVKSSPAVDHLSDLSTKQALAVVDKLAEFGSCRCVLSGGEVLLRKDSLLILKALGERGISVGMETNGLLVNSAFIELAAQLQGQRLLNITLSLDGGTAQAHEAMRGPRSFDRTVKKMEQMRDAGLLFSVQSVLHRNNYGTLPELFQLARSLAPSLINLQLAFLNPVGRGKEMIEDNSIRTEDFRRIYSLCWQEMQGETAFRLVLKSPPATVAPAFLPTLLKHPRVRLNTSCPFPLLGILPNGDVTICAMAKDDPQLNFGNIANLSLRTIWQGAGLDRLREHYQAAEQLAGICGDCTWSSACKGACRVHAYEEGGHFDAAHPLCMDMAERGDFPSLYRKSHLQKLKAGAV